MTKILKLAEKIKSKNEDKYTPDKLLKGLLENMKDGSLKNIAVICEWEGEGVTLGWSNMNYSELAFLLKCADIKFQQELNSE